MRLVVLASRHHIEAQSKVSVRDMVHPKEPGISGFRRFVVFRGIGDEESAVIERHVYVGIALVDDAE
jgi:hypothetical protein